MVRPVNALPEAIAAALGDLLTLPRPERDRELEALCAAHPEHAATMRTYAMALATLQSTPTHTGGVSEMSNDAPLRVRLRPLSGDPEPLLEPPSETRLGKYQVHDAIGFGGVGVVWRGTDQELGRAVALKVLRSGHEQHADVVRRFIEEAQIGGQLQHPGIVPVYDFGTAGGRPYFAMKLVSGHTLADELLQRGSPREARPRLLGVFLQLCQTMAYAHARGVVHRDLKPQNVMLGRFGEVQIVDWGLSKVLDAEVVAAPPPSATPAHPSSHSLAGHSLAGAVLGTPQYMPPEQARGDIAATGPWSDVFALGAMLCEILTGRPPYVADALGDGAMAKLVQRAALGDLDDAQRALQECGADDELLAICRSCLATAPQARPADASVVARQVAEYLATAEARTQSARLRTAVARTRVRQLSWLSAALLLALGAAIYFMLEARAQEAEAVAARKELSAALADANVQRDRARDSQREAEAQATLAEQRGQEAARQAERATTAKVDAEQRAEEARLARERAVAAETDARASAARAETSAAVAKQERADAIAARERTEAEKSAKEDALLQARQERDLNQRRAQLATYAAQIGAADAALARGDSRSAAVSLASCPPELRGFEWGHLQLRVDQSTHRATWDEPVVALAAGGGTVLAGLRRKADNLLFLDAASLAVRGRVTLGNGGPFAIACAPDGAQFATADGSGGVQLWRADGQPVPTRLPAAPWRITRLAFSPDGQRLAVAGHGDEIRLLELGADAPTISLPGAASGVSSLCFTDRSLLCGSNEGRLLEFTAQRLQSARTLHEGALLGLDWEPRTGTTLTAALDGAIALLGTDERIEHLAIAGAGVLNAQFSPDGARVLSAHTDQRVRVWDVTGRRLSHELLGHADYVVALATVPDVVPVRFAIVSASLDGSVRRWEPEGRGPSHLLQGAPDSQFQTIAVTGAEVFVFGLNQLRKLVWNEGGASLSVTSSANPDWRQALHAAAPRETPALGLPTPSALEAVSAAVSRDARYLLVATRLDQVFLFDTQSTDRARLTIPAADPTSSWVGSDGCSIVGTGDGRLVWADRAGQPSKSQSLGGRILAVAATDDRRLVVASPEGKALRLLRGDSETPALLRGMQRTVALAISADGQRIAAGAEDGTIRIIDSETGNELITMPTRPHAIRALAFTDADGRLLALHADGQLSIHDSDVTRAAATWRMYSSAPPAAGWANLEAIR